MSVTVLVPTRNRPQYLETVLKSIRQQTAISKIDKVIVSENGTMDGSRDVCEQFTDLPLVYVKQEQPFSVSVDHFAWLINQSSSKYTCMLHDDDWWYPTHIETALAALENEDAVCYFSNFAFSENEIFKRAFFHHPSMISHVCGNSFALDLITMNFNDVATLCYLYTPFHMSAMVALTSPFKETNEQALKNAKVWYADRIIYPYMSTIGKIVFNPQILCGIREHAKNDGKLIDAEERIIAQKEGSEKINVLAISKGVDILDNWKKIKEKIDKDDWNEVIYIYEYYFGKSEYSIFSSGPNIIPKNNPIKRIVKNLLPHGIVKAIENRN